MTKKTNKPQFSIVITQLNDKNIPPLFNDLIEQLNHDFEIIYVSTKNNSKNPFGKKINKLFKKVKTINFSTITTTETNPNTQRNIGASAANGKWILFMNHNIRLPEYFIDGIIYQIENTDDFQIFSTRVSNNTNRLHHLPVVSATNLTADFLQNIGITSVSNMFMGVKREVTLSVKFDESLKNTSNLSFVKKAKKIGFCYTIFYDPYYFCSLQNIYSEKVYKTMKVLKDANISDITSGAIGKLQPSEETTAIFNDLKSYFSSASKKQMESANKTIDSIKNYSTENGTNDDSKNDENIDVFIATAEMGHASISQTIQESLLNNKIDSTSFEKYNSLIIPYTLIYTHKPHWNKYFFTALNKPSLQKVVALHSKKHYKKETIKEIEKYNPKVLISAYFTFTSIFEELYEKNNIPFINIITDPRTAVDNNYSRNCSFNCVFDDYQKQMYEKKYPGSKSLVTGWFVRKEYEKKYNKKNIIKKLNIDPKKQVFLFVSGSVGTRATLPIIKGLISAKQPITLLVACGNNKKLLKKINEMGKQTEGTNTDITGIPFTDKLYEYMQAADLVIGKAGPNTLFESVATLTPFFATSHVGGQEDGNLEIIEEYKLGFVEENTGNALTKLLELAENPKVLKSLKPHLKKVADHNKRSKKIISDLVKEFINKS